jgi:TIR domain/NACHT domain
VNAQDSKAEIFDVFLCHNSEDKPAVREIAQKLSQENIKAWLDEADIKAGSFWHSAIGQQIETVKSAAIFIGQYGVGPWQNREMIALLDQFDRRGCPVIPAILASAPAKAALPWSLAGLHCIDFRATGSHPLKRLVWGITGERPAELAHLPASEKPVTMRDAVKGHLFPGGDDRAAASKGRFGDLEISKARYYPPLTKPPDPEQAVQLEILRRRVKEYWVDGVLKHSLHNEVLISLGKREMGQAVDAPWKYTVEVSDPTNSTPLDDRDVSTIYNATGLLLILGEPGAGKTTTLLSLARTLFDRARDDINERVPIVVNLSSRKKQQPLAEWISNELSEKYRVPRKIGRFWLHRGYLLPLLDGLDEVETVTQPDCVTAINAFIEEFNPSGLVVCCRLNEYRWLPTRLKLNGAICLEPLSSEEVSKYLAESGPKLVALREAVNTDPVLQELAQTPLMLSIMSLAFQGAGGNELATQKGEPEERRKQIFRLYVEQMFQRKGMTSLVFPKEKIIGWLSWLAERMRENSQSVFLVERLQPSWLGSRTRRIAYGIVMAFSLGLIGGLVYVLIPFTMSGQSGVLSEGLIGGLIMFAGVGLSCWSESRLKNGVMSGLICGLVGGVFYWSERAALDGVVYGLSVGLKEGSSAG